MAYFWAALDHRVSIDNEQVKSGMGGDGDAESSSLKPSGTCDQLHASWRGSQGARPALDIESAALSNGNDGKHLFGDQMTALPSFENPPVVETVLGVQFEPLEAMTNGHLGVFWDRLRRTDWPESREAQLIEPQFERFGEDVGWGPPHLQFRFTQAAAARLQLVNRAKDRMVQIQNGRLHLNWTGAKPYPRYSKVSKEYAELLAQFMEFVGTEMLGELRFNQWEVTYINFIPKNSVWQDPSEWGRVAPALLGAGLERSPLKLESVSAKARYEIPDHRGRLHIEIQHARRDTEHTDQLDGLLMNLTARGPLEGSDARDVAAGIDLGRETIVSTFERLTSNEAHAYWGKVR